MGNLRSHRLRGRMKTRHDGHARAQCWCSQGSPRYYGAMHRSRSAVNFSSLDLNLLRVFDAIHTTRSVTIASSTLHLTQPAVSKQLNRLRAILDDPLFVRTVEGMAPTPRAEALAGPIHRALIDVRTAFDS